MAESESRLFRESYYYNFFQLVYLLEKAYKEAPAPGESSDIRKERIRFRGDPALVFPASDVRSVELIEGPNPHALITATFMGLYGVDSPMPLNFHEHLGKRQEDSKRELHQQVLREFLDIFNHRFYSFFYRTWKTSRPELYLRRDMADDHSQRFLSMAGIGTSKTMDAAPVSPMWMASFAAQFGGGGHPEGLAKMLSDWLDGTTVNILENIPRLVKVDERPAVGTGEISLGRTALVGTHVYDTGGQFRLQIGPIGVDLYRELRPGGARADVLVWLTRSYASDYLDFDAELLIKTEELPRLRLSGGFGELGSTAFLGRPREAVVSRVVSYN